MQKGERVDFNGCRNVRVARKGTWRLIRLPGTNWRSGRAGCSPRYKVWGQITCLFLLDLCVA